MFAEQFLVSPSLFPARLAGETWGTLSALLNLPAGPYRVDGLLPDQHAALAGRFGDVVVPDRGAPAFELLIYRAPATDFRAIDTRGWEYALDFSPVQGRLSLAGMRLMAVLDFDERRGAVWTSAGESDELPGIIENVLRPLIAFRLLDAGGLMVHSAAVSLDGRGLLFAGPSGAGKSTIAGLALRGSHPVLSDDLNAVVAEGRRFVLQPLPFTGDLEPFQVSREAVGLEVIAGLRKGSVESLEPMKQSELASLIVRSAPYVNIDERRAGFLLQRAGEIAGAVRPAWLTFRRDGDIWPILRSL